MGIAKSTYYHETLREERQLEKDLQLRDMIDAIHEEFPGYGYRRIREHLLRQGKRVNAKRVRRVMNRYGLFSVLKRAFKVPMASLGQRMVFPNLIQGTKITSPNQIWAADITYIRLLRQYVFLAAIIDVYTRKIVGWAISKSLSHELCLQALEVAVKREKPEPGLIHHSDRGTQYTSSVYVHYLTEKKFQISMSRKSTPEDNAFIESFFRTLKREEVYVRKYETIQDALKKLPKFINEVYNTKRLHSSLGYKSPKEFEAEILNLKPADRPVQKIWGDAV